MTKGDFDKLDRYILQNLEIQNPFNTTTTQLFGRIKSEIRLNEGHIKVYEEFIKYSAEINLLYSVRSFHKSTEDIIFDIEFTKK